MSKVSIITPTYNGEKYIAATIKSVQQQNYQHYKHIIIDNGSTDGTNAIIESFAKNDSRIMHIKNKQNHGIVGGRNQGIEQSYDDIYICFLDQDDLRSDKNKLVKQVDILDENKKIGLVGSFCEYIDEKGTITGKMKYAVTNNEIRNNMLIYNQFCTCAVMFRKSLLQKVGMLNEKYEKVDDYDLRLRLGKISECYNIPEYLVQYRKHAQNTSKDNKIYLTMKKMHLKLIFDNFWDYPNRRYAVLFGMVNAMIPYVLAEKIKKFLLH